MKKKQFTKEDYMKYLSLRSDVTQDFLYHVLSKIGKPDQYKEEQFIKEYSKLSKTTRCVGRGTMRGRQYGKKEWNQLIIHGIITI